jgi:cell division inhibitor SulA
MLNTKNSNINMINSISEKKPPVTINWLQHTNVVNDFEISNQYAHICHQHKQEKKWVLFINPEENSIEKLAKTHGVDVSKILMVNYKNTDENRAKIALGKITSVLSKGNCSAVILLNSLFDADEIAQLESSATAGQTHCILMKQCQLH